MALELRGTSSLFRRAEQLRRWTESETNKQDVTNKNAEKVKFTDGCIFLAAGAAEDKEELKKLLNRGADINTANEDGITALHAACIDSKYDIIEFLLNHGADINHQDLEGWTPLHATANCGYLSIAEVLVNRGADLSIVNNDGDLAIDVSSEEEMIKFLQNEMDKRGINADASRSCEERQMLTDAREWLKKSTISDIPHPKSGATALHVAAAKGYVNVMRLLLELGLDTDRRDFDGWTPLHAAAHWGQREAIELLCENNADVDVLNNVGQTAFDLADETVRPLLEELSRKQSAAKTASNLNKNVSKKRKSSPPRDRLTKKEKEYERDEATKMVTCNDTEYEQSDVQSWRRASLKNNSNENNNNNTTSRINEVQNNEEVVLRKKSLDQRNVDEEMHVEVTKSDKEISDVTTLPKTISSETKNLQKSADLIQQNGLSQPSPFSKMTAGNVIRNFFKSFAPPLRDEESETQRKAHAKMVRSTRRSTQGITLEDVKSAEQYIKGSTQIPTVSTSTTVSSLPSPVATTSVSTSTISTSNELIVNNLPCSKVDDSNASTPLINSNREPFCLEKTSQESNLSASRTNGPKDDASNVGLMLKKSLTIGEDKKAAGEDNSEDKSTSSTREGTQAVIQRRRKPKRRSTGKVQFDQENDSNSKNETYQDVNSDSQLSGKLVDESSTQNKTEVNGEIDYKKLYEEQLLENSRLLERLRISDKDLKTSRDNLEKNNRLRHANEETERREKRALERKISEMDEEVKRLKMQNQSLKDENGALIRVISKLSR